MSWLLIDWGSASDLAIREVSFTKIASIKLDEHGVDHNPSEMLWFALSHEVEKCLLFHDYQCYWDIDAQVTHENILLSIFAKLSVRWMTNPGVYMSHTKYNFGLFNSNLYPNWSTFQ